jgi:hypothetical protein
LTATPPVAIVPHLDAGDGGTEPRLRAPKSTPDLLERSAMPVTEASRHRHHDIDARLRDLERRVHSLELELALRTWQAAMVVGLIVMVVLIVAGEPA